jgi:hypothetical protein
MSLNTWHAMCTNIMDHRLTTSFATYQCNPSPSTRQPGQEIYILDIYLKNVILHIEYMLVYVPHMAQVLQ